MIGMYGLLSVAWPAYAAEHGGQEHGGTTTAPAATKEHGGLPAAPTAQAGTTQKQAGQAVKAEPSTEQIRQTIKSYVQGVAQKNGAFPIKDPVTGTTRNMEFVRVHDRVGKTGSLYYSCTDMRDKQTGELLDLDFDIKATGEQLKVVDQRIHKVAGKARYTYDEHDNRIPVRSTSSPSTPGQERVYY
ncbi:MAG: hypothetical protein HYZ89_05370 [Candidatus Omnitrophica bacterium]|nr:hypothetical protein [Candidatus Omnitrophota bacterium]